MFVIDLVGHVGAGILAGEDGSVRGDGPLGRRDRALEEDGVLGERVEMRAGLPRVAVTREPVGSQCV
jgi:hypothetical protein